jgi:hypothetical protein
MSYILSDYHGIKLEIDNKRNNKKYRNAWRMRDSLLFERFTFE